MSARRHRFQRFCALLLLALVVSPLTAPFSAGHPLDLLGGPSAHVQSKKAPDDPVVSLGTTVVAFTSLSIARDESTPVPTGNLPHVHAHSTPLRL